MADDEEQATATMAEGGDPAKSAAGEADAEGIESETEGECETDSRSETDAESGVAEWRDKYLRLQAEFDNYRKRTLREKMDLVASGGADVLKCMLSVLDDVHRAVAASEKRRHSFAARGRASGGAEIRGCLASEGRERDRSVRQGVRSRFPRGRGAFRRGRGQKGLVIDVVQRGYMLGEKVLRYAKVVVGE